MMFDESGVPVVADGRKRDDEAWVIGDFELSVCGVMVLPVPPLPPEHADNAKAASVESAKPIRVLTNRGVMRDLLVRVHERNVSPTLDSDRHGTITAFACLMNGFVEGLRLGAICFEYLAWKAGGDTDARARRIARNLDRIRERVHERNSVSTLHAIDGFNVP